MSAVRRVGALLAAGALAALGGAGTAAAQTPPSTGPAPVQAYGACLNNRHTGDLLLLIDESESLVESDKQAARVTAANYLLSQLAGQTERAKITLDVQVAGFATTFDPNPTPWTPLTAANLPGLTSTVNGFAQRNKGLDTDYWLALEGARRSLADHAKEAAGGQPGGGDRCQAIAWFSDGKLSIEPRTRDDGSTLPYAEGVDIATGPGAEQAEKAAAASLCRPQGQADQLRNGHVVMFGIGLSGPTASDADFGLMRSITTGAPYENAPCGAITQPPPGTFQLASDVDTLLFAFDNILGTPDVAGTNTICAAADTSCRGQEFVLDESIDGFRILGQADAVPGLTAELIGPDGAAHPLPVKDPGKATDLSFGPVRGTYTWQTDRTVSIEISDTTRQAAGWAGVWALRFVDPAATTSSGSSKTNIRIWGNVLAGWKGAKDAVPGGAPVPDVRVGLFREADNSEVDPNALRGTFSVNVDLVDPAGAVTSVARGLDRSTIADPLTLDLTSVKPGPATLRLSLDLTTAPGQRPGTGETVPGTKLSTQYRDVTFTVEPPLGYPKLPARLDFGSVEGGTDLTTTLPVTGPGCVWVPAEAAPTVATTPDRVSAVTITADGATTPQSCLSLADGQTGAVTLHLRADHTGNGTASGTLPVSIAPRDRPDQARTVDVAFTGDLRTPLNRFNQITVLIVALLLGPGIPLGLLYLVKRATAKIPARGLYTRVIPVTVAGDRTLRDGAPFAFRDTDFVDLADIPSGGTRRLVVDDVVLRTRTGASPFGSGYVSVEPTNPQVVCLAPGEAQPRGLTSRLPLAVHRSWVVLHNPAGPPDAARVLVLLGADTPAAQRAEFAAEIAERLPEVFERLRATLERSGDGGRPPGGDTRPPATVGAGPDYGPAGGAYGPAGGTYGPAGGTYGPAGSTAYGPPGGATAYGPPSFGPPSYGPSGGTSAYGPTDYGPPAHGPSGGTTPYGPADGGASYGAPRYGSPQHGSPQYGSPQHGGAPPTNPVDTPYSGWAGPTQNPAPPSYGAPTWDGRYGDEGGGTTRPVGPDDRGGARDDPPDHPTYGPRG